MIKLHLRHNWQKLDTRADINIKIALLGFEGLFN